MNIGKYIGEIVRVVEGRCKVIPATKNRGLIHSPGEILDAMAEGVA
jgi:hypothetical protein